MKPAFDFAPIAWRRRRRVLTQALAITVAALLSANGAVAAERITEKDLRQILADFVRPDGVGARPGTGVVGEATAQGSSDLGPEMADASPFTITSEHAISPGSIAAPTIAGRRPAPPAGQRHRPGGEGTSLTTERAETMPPASGAQPNSTTADSGSTTTTTLTGKTSPTTSVTSPGETLAATVTQVANFVQRKRGLAFKRGVPVRLLAPADFKARFAGLRKASSTEIQISQGLLRALGVIGNEVDVAAQVQRLADQPAFAIYDPGTDEILLSTDDPTPMLRTALAREFTRALEHHWYGIVPPGAEGSLDQARQGFQALVEGTALVISDLYLATLSSQEKSEVEAERARLAARVADVPTAVTAAVTFPYVSGPSVVAALVKAGGASRLNAAHQAPPVTAEHLLDPARYLAGEQAKPVAGPPAGGGVVKQGSLGQLLLQLMLATTIDAPVAKQAAAGWGGDSYVLWTEGGRTCLRATFAMDSPEDEGQLADALAQWAARGSGAEIDAASPLTFTRCA